MLTNEAEYISSAMMNWAKRARWNKFSLVSPCKIPILSGINGQTVRYA
jgi:hypothetical protein